MAPDNSAGSAGPPDDEMGRELVMVPGFQAGGRVERTGIALVHQGEYIFPSPGSEAAVSDVPAPDAGTIVNFYFPVEVEVVGELSPAQLKAVSDFVVEELTTAFRNRLG